MSRSEIRSTSEHAQPPAALLEPREVLIQVVVALAMFAIGVLLTGCEVIQLGAAQ
jgi:hypothetical protein